MSIQLDEAQTTLKRPDHEEIEAGEWDLDVTFVEAGDAVKHLIYMTDDQCGTTCQSACTTTCP